MARTTLRNWSAVVLVAVSFAALASCATPAAAWDGKEATAAAAPADNNPFGAPAKAAGAAAKSTVDDSPFGSGRVGRARGAAPASAGAAKGPSDFESEALIHEALLQPTNMDFIETPLAQVVDFLKDLHGIHIQLDHRALQEANVGSDLPITQSAHDVSLGSALRLLLRAHDLTYVVCDGVMLISTPAAVQKMVELRVYDVGDLTGEDADAEDLIAILRLALEPQPASGQQDQETAACSGASQIMPFGNLLVVRASIVQQQAAGDLLDELRKKTHESK